VEDMRQLLCDYCGQVLATYLTDDPVVFTHTIRIGHTTRDVCNDCIDKVVNPVGLFNFGGIPPNRPYGV
jgi:hypothetical protein